MVPALYFILIVYTLYYEKLSVVYSWCALRYSGHFSQTGAGLLSNSYFILYTFPKREALYVIRCLRLTLVTLLGVYMSPLTAVQSTCTSNAPTSYISHAPWRLHVSSYRSTKYEVRALAMPLLLTLVTLLGVYMSPLTAVQSTKYVH